MLIRVLPCSDRPPSTRPWRSCEQARPLRTAAKGPRLWPWQHRAELSDGTRQRHTAHLFLQPSRRKRSWHRVLDNVFCPTFSIRHACCLFFLLCAGGPASAELGTSLAVGRIEASGWVISQARVELHTQGLAFGGSLIAGMIQPPGNAPPLRKVNLSCGQIQLQRTLFTCTGGRLKDSTGILASVPSLTLRRNGREWAVRGQLNAVDLTTLSSLIPAVMPQAPELSAAGKLRVRIQANGRDNGDIEGSVRLETEAMALSNAESTIATDNLAAVVDLGFTLGVQRAALTLNAQLLSGYGFANPVLHDYSRFPAKLELKALWDLQRSELRLNSLRWQQPGVAVLSATGTLLPNAAEAVKDLRISLEHAQFPGLYSQLLEPLLAGTPLDELSTSGDLRGEVWVVNNQPRSGSLEISQVHLDDRERRFAVYGLDGMVNWWSASRGEKPAAEQPAAKPSSLSWEGLYLGRLPFGAARWDFYSSGSNIRSASPLHLGFFDGAIAVENFLAQGIGSPEFTLAFQAALEPVSLPLVTSALGLPSFPGKVTGRLPPVRYQDNQLQFGGALTAEAFGGKLTVEHLQVDDPLGLVPRASADVQLRALDLSQLTSVFDFGRIEGQLSADISALQLQAWLPVAFNAHLYTPANDPSPHRISQRAVNNISRVGGSGAAAALSSSFMRYFENFGYKRIGWSCVLRKGVCTMGGAGPARDNKGYYLVEGRGLPRIDVVGHAQEVSWDTLLKQLKTLSTSAPPSVR